MHTLKAQLQEMFGIAALRAFNLRLFSAEITPSTQSSFGHYQCNSALKLAKELKRPPRDVAQALIDHLPNRERFKEVAVAGPGFINIQLAGSYLELELARMITDDRLGVRPSFDGQKVIVEYSSPNIAKELHVGHLRSTIIGESIARLLEFIGYSVLRLNHIGDFGTQFGMLIAYIAEYQAEVFKDGQAVSIEQLMDWYKQSKKLFDEDEAFKKRAQLKVVALQSQEKEAISAWQRICEISRFSYEEIYGLLEVSLMERGESFYQPYLADIVKTFLDHGVAEYSDGAACVFMEGYQTAEKQPLPLIIQKSDGGYNYATTDLAALYHRINHEQADRVIYVVDAGQKLHFDMVFDAAQKSKILDRSRVRVEHIGFGVVLGEDGKKFKTRSGETVKLIDLLMEAVHRAKQILTERIKDAGEQEMEALAIALGINAVKYADLSCHRMKDYQFSYDRMLRFEGNTAAFLLYSYVRILSIEKKAVGSIEGLPVAFYLEDPREIDLALHLLRFSECIKEFEESLLPNQLCDYLFTLADQFNQFFRDCKVIGDAHEVSRRMLCAACRKVFEAGFSILGIRLMQRM